MSTGEHFIVVTAETEDRDAEYELECSGITSGCEAWTECLKCRDADLEPYYDGDEDRHGEWHQVIDGVWMTATGRCLLHVCDASESAIGLLYDYDGRQALAAGRHRIAIDDCEEGTVSISLSRVAA